MKKKSSQKLFDLSNKVIILTGSGGRLGTNFAHTLADAGADLVLIDIDKKKNKKLENSILTKFKTKILCSNADITEKEELQILSKQILKKFKKIDGLVNNAFYSPRTNVEKSAMMFEEFELELWNKVVSVNLTGIFLCSQIFGKIMAKQKTENTIVNISSIYGINEQIREFTVIVN